MSRKETFITFNNMIQNNFDLNQHQIVVENLISEGYVIIQLVVGGVDVMYFVAHEFEPPIHSSVQDVPYGQIKGCNITEFMRVNGGQTDKRLLISRFKEAIMTLPVIRVQFDERTNWYKWVSE